jgi:hypothetical protein
MVKPNNSDCTYIVSHVIGTSSGSRIQLTGQHGVFPRRDYILVATKEQLEQSKLNASDTLSLLNSLNISQDE